MRNLFVCIFILVGFYMVSRNSGFPLSDSNVTTTDYITEDIADILSVTTAHAENQEILLASTATTEIGITDVPPATETGFSSTQMNVQSENPTTTNKIPYNIVFLITKGNPVKKTVEEAEKPTKKIEQPATADTSEEKFIYLAEITSNKHLDNSSEEKFKTIELENSSEEEKTYGNQQIFRSFKKRDISVEKNISENQKKPQAIIHDEE